MNNIKIVLDQEIVRNAILKSDEMKNIVEGFGVDIKKKLESETREPWEMETKTGRYRVKSRISPGNIVAYRRNQKHNTVHKIIESMRIE